MGVEEFGKSMWSWKVFMNYKIFSKRYIQKIYSKMYLVSYANTHHYVTDSVNHGMVKNTKTWISWDRCIIFLWNKKILNLCLWWPPLRSYRFVAEVTFQLSSIICYLISLWLFNILCDSTTFVLYIVIRYFHLHCYIVLTWVAIIC